MANRKRMPILDLLPRGQVFFSAGQHLYRWYKNEFSAISFPEKIIELAVMPTLKSATSLIAIGMTHGAAVIHDLNHWDQHEILPQEYRDARVAFTPSNYLVVAGDDRVGIYKADRKGVVFESSLKFDTQQQPLCYSPGTSGNTFEVVTVAKTFSISIERR